mmetsp:Transcript_14009/g.37221  ORF Transcript_14009/g.37221 Transcript_14009/m.37221 type:complete len:228 (+) Transcript_14009:734-1417(+)
MPKTERTAPGSSGPSVGAARDCAYAAAGNAIIKATSTLGQASAEPAPVTRHDVATSTTAPRTGSRILTDGLWPLTRPAFSCRAAVKEWTLPKEAQRSANAAHEHIGGTFASTSCRTMTARGICCCPATLSRASSTARRIARRPTRRCWRQGARRRTRARRSCSRRRAPRRCGRTRSAWTTGRRSPRPPFRTPSCSTSGSATKTALRTAPSRATPTPFSRTLITSSSP